LNKAPACGDKAGRKKCFFDPACLQGGGILENGRKFLPNPKSEKAPVQVSKAERHSLSSHCHWLNLSELLGH